MRPPRIQVLPPDVAERIAAGEVVERPASVVKELVENSIDAGARRIRVETDAGGKASILVSDDGCGMTPEEAELALLRHATSKIRAAEDLFNIHTLGFRGEALPSIAVISELELTTRQEEVPDGFRLLVVGGNAVARGTVAAPVGTSVSVRRLFFNTPARQKFMKSDNAEAAQVAEVVQRLALASPQVAFSVVHDGVETLRTPGTQEPLNTVVALLGRQVAREVVPVDHASGSGVRVTGFAGLPTLSRASRAQQQFFVNGRPVRSPLFYRAVDDAYSSRMPAARKAVVILFVEVPPGDVDVNVHPSKIEVRFGDEAGVHDAIRRAVDLALARPAAAGSVAAPMPAPAPPPRSQRSIPAVPAPLLRETPPAPRPAAPAVVRDALSFAEAALAPPAPAPRPRSQPPPPAAAPAPPAPAAAPVSSPSAQPAIGELKLLGQTQDLFILAEGGGQFWIIDQHVAHERVLFDRLTGDPARSEPADPLLVPLSLELDAREELAVAEHLELLADLQFMIEPFGKGRIQLRAIPRSLTGRNYESALRDLVDELTEQSNGGQVRLRRDQIALAAAGRACKAAVKAGMPLSPPEMERLLQELAQTRDPYTCPHGRPVFLTYDRRHVAGLFGSRECD